MELEINGIKADVRNVIAITRSVLNVENISERTFDITNRFSLPDTQTNRQIFGSPGVLNSNNRGLDRNYQAKIIDQFFIFNGIGFLTEVNDNYQFQLVDRSSGLFNAMKLKLNTIDLEAFDIVFDASNYDTLKLETSSVWIWPAVQMHVSKITDKSIFASSPNNLKYTRPFFNVKNLLTEALSGNGWTFDYAGFDLAISSNSENFFVTSYQKTITRTQGIVGSFQLDELDINDFENDVTTFDDEIFNNNPTIFRLRGEIETDADFEIIFDVNEPSLDVATQSFFIKANQTFVDITTEEFVNEDDPMVTTPLIATITLVGTGTFEFVGTLLYTLISENSLDLSTNPLLDFKVKAHDNLPDITQIDLFRTLLKVNNAIILPDSFNKNIEIKSISEVNKLNGVDWSDKFIVNSEVINNTFGSLAKENNLIYDNDDTVINTLGQSSFSTNIDRLESEGDFLGISLGASREVTISANLIADSDIYNNTTRVNEINTRLITFEEDEFSVFTLGRFDPIDWKTLRAGIYKDFLDSLLRPRIVECSMNLNKLDVFNHDFLKLVYIDELKSQFFVVEIEDFIPGEPTGVTLLKWL